MPGCPAQVPLDRGFYSVLRLGKLNERVTANRVNTHGQGLSAILITSAKLHSLMCRSNLVRCGFALNGSYLLLGPGASDLIAAEVVFEVNLWTSSRSRPTLLGSIGEFLQPAALFLVRRKSHAQLRNNQCLLDGWQIRRCQLQFEDMRSVVSSGLSVGQNQVLD